MLGLSLWIPFLSLVAPVRELSTSPTPPAPVTSGTAQARRARPETLFINFDGAVLQAGCGNNAHYDCSTLLNTFDGYVAPYRGSTSQQMAILDATRRAVSDFGIRVIVHRPPADENYTMVLYGDLGPQSFAGLAPYIDCEDIILNDTSFTQAYSSSNTGSTVILQEAAHTWGLEHVDSEFDIMNPFKSTSTQRFLDECLPIVANTELERTPGSCNQIHSVFCDPGWQNSYQEMLYLFGPPVPDVEPPTLDIVYPEEDSTFVYPTSLSLVGEISDDMDPQYYAIEVFNHGELAFSEDGTALDLVLRSPPAGDYDLLVRLTDEGGNSVEDRVRFTILPEASPIDDPLSSPSEGPTCGIGHPNTTWSVLLVGWFCLARRRRHQPGSAMR